MTEEEVTEADLPHLRRCVELATEAVEAGDFPFGSVLVAADGTVLAEDRNREVTAGDPTRHPEFALARWAATNMTPPERARRRSKPPASAARCAPPPTAGQGSAASCTRPHRSSWAAGSPTWESARPRSCPWRSPRWSPDSWSPARPPN